MEGGKPTIIPNAEGGRTTPSVVAFTKTGDRLVGQVRHHRQPSQPVSQLDAGSTLPGRQRVSSAKTHAELGQRAASNLSTKSEAPAASQPPAQFSAAFPLTRLQAFIFAPAPIPPLQIAKRQGVVNPENTFFSVKRFMGRKMGEVGDESKQVRAAP